MGIITEIKIRNIEAPCQNFYHMALLSHYCMNSLPPSVKPIAFFEELTEIGHFFLNPRNHAEARRVTEC